MSDGRQNAPAYGDGGDERISLELETLGAAALLRRGPGGHRAVVFGPSKPLALIVYLASIPGGSATREFLIDLLWADLEPEPARHAFRQTLWYIKQKAGPAVLRTTGDLVSLAETLPSDRAEFLRFVEARDFDAAVALYGGDFIPDFAVPGGVEFEHWADLERRRLRDTFVRSAEHGVRHHLSVSHHREASALARRARDADPLNERAWRLLLEALVSANDHLGAAMEADALQRMLTAEEHAAEPATRAMLRAVRQASAAAQAEVAPASLVAEMVGREAEFSTLLAAWEQARAGLARRVVILGPPGIGKTRLITDAVARLRARRSRVVWTRANPGEREIPYALLSQVAAALAELPGAAAVSAASAGSLVALNPSLSAAYHAAPDGADGEEALRRRAIAVHELLAAVADEAPVALIADDLHWADEASRRVLSSVVDRLEREQVLFVGAARSSSGTGMTAARQLTFIRPQPLDQSAVGAMLATIGALPGRPGGERLAELLWRATEGVPLLVLETLHWLVERRLLVLEQGAWQVPDEDALADALTAGGALGRRVEAVEPGARRLLAVLSVAGAPVDAGFLATAAGRSPADVAAQLQELEGRGLAARSADGWAAAHDHISEVVCSPLAGDQLKALHGAVARAWMEAGGPTDRALRSAGAHFARAGERGGVARAFAAWVHRRREQADPRPVRTLAVEFLGDDDPLDVQRLVRALPLRQRIGWSRWRTAAAIVFVAAASAAATWQWTRPPVRAPDDVFLAVAVDSAGDTTTYQVPIRRSQWSGGDLILLSQQERAIRTALPPSLLDFTLGPEGRSWISWMSMPDSGAVDLVQVSMTGNRERLTWAPGDDASPDLSPDDSQLVFSSGRFDSLSHNHIAVMSLATHRVRQLTRLAGAQGTPRWSPAGTRIAFGDYPFSDASDSVCTIAPDGFDLKCTPTGPSPAVLGWVDDDRVAFTTQADSLMAVWILDTRDHTMRRIVHTSAGAYLLSPDGRWLSCQCRAAGAMHVQTVVLPVDQPDLVRVVAEDALDTRPVAVLWDTPAPARWVTALSIPVPAGGLSVGMDFRPPVYASTVDGRVLTVQAPEESSLDPALLRITHDGGLLPVAPGIARLVVSAGGWRVDTIPIRITSAAESLVLRDDWSRGAGGNFVPFGVPRPLVVSDPAGGKAFWNRGDGNFPSGAYSNRSLDASRGLGLETTLSLPITMVQWQSEAIDLRPLMDSAALAGWDHASGYPPFDAWPMSGACFAAYPSGEGARSLRELQVPGGTVDPDTLFTPPLHDGHWFRVRLQLFPDGRCGVAINGRPVAINTTGALPTRHYFATIEGQSYRTRILAGPVEIWTGIKPGVDWLAFDTARVTATARPSASRGAPRSP